MGHFMAWEHGEGKDPHPAGGGEQQPLHGEIQPRKGSPASLRHVFQKTASGAACSERAFISIKRGLRCETPDGRLARVPPATLVRLVQGPAPRGPARLQDAMHSGSGVSSGEEARVA